MLQKVSRLFVIKTRFEAALIVYALALGAAERGKSYLVDWPGWSGKILFIACCAGVLMAGAKIFECLRFERAFRSSEASQPTTATQVLTLEMSSGSQE